jgi:hypothetical protein
MVPIAQLSRRFVMEGIVMEGKWPDREPWLVRQLSQHLRALVAVYRAALSQDQLVLTQLFFILQGHGLGSRLRNWEQLMREIPALLKVLKVRSKVRHSYGRVPGGLRFEGGDRAGGVGAGRGVRGGEAAIG